MNHLRIISLVLAVFGVGLFGLAAKAAPVIGSQELASTTNKLANPNAPILVRRCHRGWQKHYVGRWDAKRWHRHVGPRCRPIKPRRVHLGPKSPEHGCLRIGDVWICT